MSRPCSSLGTRILGGQLVVAKTPPIACSSVCCRRRYMYLDCLMLVPAIICSIVSGRISVVRCSDRTVEQPTLVQQPRDKRPSMTLGMRVEPGGPAANRIPQSAGSGARNSCAVAANSREPTDKLQGPQASGAGWPGSCRGAGCRLVDQDSRTSENILPSGRIGPVRPSDPCYFPHPAPKSHLPFQLHHESQVRLASMRLRQDGGSHGRDQPRLPARVIGRFMMCSPAESASAGKERDARVVIHVPAWAFTLGLADTKFNTRKEKRRWWSSTAQTRICCC